MPNTLPPCRRDGSWYVIDDYCLIGGEVAHYPRYAGKWNIDKLESIVLNHKSNMISAFDTDGWIREVDFQGPDAWKKKDGCSTYVRVDYPGWVYLPYANSIGNSLPCPAGLKRGVLLMAYVMVQMDAESSAKVAAFDSDGELKSRVDYFQLKKNYYNHPLQGLYIRTEFAQFAFFPKVDSSGHDLYYPNRYANDIPDLIRGGTSTLDIKFAGFNTNGQFKSELTVPPHDKLSTGISYGTEGTYVRTEFPGFIFLPDLDSSGDTQYTRSGKTLVELVQIAVNDTQVNAFNTMGEFKYKVSEMPVERSYGTSPYYHGLYVKATFDPNDPNFGIGPIPPILSAVVGVAQLWGKWLVNDAQVRQQYVKMVSQAAKEIGDAVNSGSQTSRWGAIQASILRNIYLRSARQTTSPLGLVFAEGYKPSSTPYTKFLDKYAQEVAGVPFWKVTDLAQEAKIAEKIIGASGRANSKFTASTELMSPIGKAIVAITVIYSLVTQVVADDWGTHMGEQLGLWTGSILGGTLGQGVGKFIKSPIGPLLGGNVGAYIGGFYGEQAGGTLARWFWGGSSSESGMALLGETFSEAIQISMANRFATSGRQWDIHQVLSKHIQKSNDLTATGASLSELVEDVLRSCDSDEAQDTEDEIIATVVWVSTESNGAQALNPANPGDLYKLADWVINNLPDGQS